MHLNVIVYCVVFFHVVLSTNVKHTCEPQLKIFGKHKIDGTVYIDCMTLDCEETGNITFEKTGIKSSSHSTPVYDAHHGPLDTDGQYAYTLEFRSRHSNSSEPPRTTLVIDKVIPHDHGSWRCVATIDGERYTSETKDINIIVKPKVKEMVITPDKQHIVTEQKHNFTCLVENVHPRPSVLWRMNDSVRDDGKSNDTRQANGIWTVQHSIQQLFKQSGTFKLQCVLALDDENYWVQKEMTLIVRDSAKVVFPKKDHTREIFANDTFNLECKGKGFGYTIIWMKDNTPITNDNRYIIKGCEASQSQECTSSLTSIPVTNETQCPGVYNYAGVYTCIVRLDPPFTHFAESPTARILISNKPVVIGIPKNITNSRCTKQTVLSCNVCARTLVTDVWYYERNEINDKKLLHTLSGTIESDMFNFGKYTRVVKTKGGVVNCTVHLNPEEFVPCHLEIIAIVSTISIVSFVVCVVTLIFVENKESAGYIYLKGHWIPNK